jgi:hypothetical protein
MKTMIKPIVLKLVRIYSFFVVFTKYPLMNFRYLLRFYKYRNIQTVDILRYKPWTEYENEIKNIINNKLPLFFFASDIMTKTMTGNDLTAGNILLGISSKVELDYKIKPTVIGGGIIPLNNIFSNLTAQRMMHLYQFNCIMRELEQERINSPTIVEWGGGYAGLALIIFGHLKCTVIVRDLPNVSILQYIYLKSHLDHVVLHRESNQNIEKGVVNLIPSNIVNNNITADLFISFWALSESCIMDYNDLVDKNFYHSRKNLIISQKSSPQFPVSHYLSGLASNNIKIHTELVPGMNNGSFYISTSGKFLNEYIE